MKLPILRKKNKIITIIKPYGSSLLNISACLYGRKPIATLPPSRGGIGTILKTARMALIIALTLKIACNGTRTVLESDDGIISDSGKITKRIITILSTARTMFIKGPAAAERAMSLLGFLKFCGLIGTGFAHPIV